MQVVHQIDFQGNQPYELDSRLGGNDDDDGCRVNKFGLRFVVDSQAAIRSMFRAMV